MDNVSCNDSQCFRSIIILVSDCNFICITRSHSGVTGQVSRDDPGRGRFSEQLSHTTGHVETATCSTRKIHGTQVTVVQRQSAKT